MTDNMYTHIALVVDRSGSMAKIENDMNPAIIDLLAEQSKQEGRCVVDITTFDDKVEHPYVGVAPDDVKGEVIKPRGVTALLDAVGYTIVELGERFEKMQEDERPGLVVFVVVTDGLENASKEYTREQVKALVEQQTKEYNWQFMYLAANVDAFATGGGMGFSRGSTIAFDATNAGVTNSYASTSGLISKGRAANAKGAKVSMTYTDEDRDEAKSA